MKVDTVCLYIHRYIKYFGWILFWLGVECKTKPQELLLLLPLDAVGSRSFDAPTPPSSPQTTSSLFFIIPLGRKKNIIMHVQLALLVHPQKRWRVFLMPPQPLHNSYWCCCIFLISFRKPANVITENLQPIWYLVTPHKNKKNVWFWRKILLKSVEKKLGDHTDVVVVGSLKLTRSHLFYTQVNFTNIRPSYHLLPPQFPWSQTPDMNAPRWQEEANASRFDEKPVGFTLASRHRRRLGTCTSSREPPHIFCVIGSTENTNRERPRCKMFISVNVTATSSPHHLLFKTCINTFNRGRLNRSKGQARLKAPRIEFYCVCRKDFHSFIYIYRPGIHGGRMPNYFYRQPVC